MSVRLDHIGHVVHDIDDARNLYETALGLVPSLVMNHPITGALMIFYPYAGIEIELIQPGDMPEDVARQCLNRRGEGFFHLSLVPDDYDAEIGTWRSKGFTVTEFAIEEPRGPIRLAFLKPEEVHGLWIEFIDTSKLCTQS